MQKHNLCLFLAIIAAFLFPINASCADAPNPVAPKLVTGSNNPPRTIQQIFPIYRGELHFTSLISLKNHEEHQHDIEL
jgi:hypothetical protein